jgi:hypothetical protein
MRCTSCHTELAPQARFCHVCRTPVPSSPSTRTEEEAVRVGPVSFDEASAASDGQNSSQALPYPEHASTASKPEERVIPSASGMPAPVYGPYPPRQSHLVRNLIIVIAVLVVLLGGMGALLLSHLPTSPTPAVITIPTAITRPAGTTTPIVTDPQVLYTQVTSSTPALSDSLGSQGSTTWQPSPGDTNSSCAYTGGALHVQGATGGLAACFDTKDSYGDFGLEVQMTILQGNLAGIAFRLDPFGHKAYFFAVFKPNAGNPGFYVLLPFDVSSNNPSSHTLGQGTFPAGQSRSIVLTVIARSSTIYLYINRQFVQKVEDTTSVSGLLGLLADSAKTSADVAYSNLKIWKL